MVIFRNGVVTIRWMTWFRNRSTGWGPATPQNLLAYQLVNGVNNA